MRLLVIGGTGRTGRRIVEAALAEGWVPVVLGRSATVDTVPAGAEAFAGNVVDPGVLDEALTGVEAVVTALSIPRTSRSPFAPLAGAPDLHSRSIRLLCDAMARQGVRRIVKISAQGVGESAARAGWLFRALVATSNLAPAFADHAIADELLRASDLDWTIARPPALVDGDADGGLRAGEALVTTSFTRARTGDVAAFVVASLRDPAWIGRCVTLAPR